MPRKKTKTKTRKRNDLSKTKKLKQEEFLVKFVESGWRVIKTCEAIGITPQCYYAWLERDPEFRERIDNLQTSLRETLRTAAIQRALKKSDNLLMFLLKALDPEKFDDNIRKLNYLRDKLKEENLEEFVVKFEEL